MPRLHERSWLATLVLVSLFSLSGQSVDRGLPRLVFVSRLPDPAHLQVPGIGPLGRTLATGGRLRVRERDGRVHALLPEGRFFDVSDPTVSYDGRAIVFAATEGPERAWRLWLVMADGSGLRQLTKDDRTLDLSAWGSAARLFERYDDFDPCWLPDGRIAFASTRFPLESQHRGIVVSNLWVVRADGSELMRLGSERNGAEEPSIDPTRGRLVFARWWFNRWFPARDGRRGVTSDLASAMPADTVDLWHAISSERDGDLLRLQGGDARVRSGQMTYEPVVFADTTLVGVKPERSSFLPSGLRLGIQVFRGGLAEARPLAGYGSAIGVSACSPEALRDGRLLFSLDDDGDGDFGLYSIGLDGRRLARIFDEPGTLELDATALEPRPVPPPPMLPTYYPLPPDDLPRSTLASVLTDERNVRFDCLNVFANAGVDVPIPDALPIQRDLRIRFWTTLPRPGNPAGDSLVLVQEEPVTPTGGVFVDASPSEQPMFEQLVDASGRVVRSAGGPAHVPGFNFARPGGGTKCVGCHVGHSFQHVADTRGQGEFTNLSTSAQVTASQSLAGTVGPRGAVDRRTKGQPGEVAWWFSTAEPNPWLRLAWNTPIEANGIVVYPLSSSSRGEASSRVRRADIVLLLAGREVRRLHLDRVQDPKGIAVRFDLTRMDALEFRPLEARGSFHDVPAAAVAEIETFARLAWE